MTVRHVFGEVGRFSDIPLEGVVLLDAVNWVENLGLRVGSLKSTTSVNVLHDSFIDFVSKSASPQK